MFQENVKENKGMFFLYLLRSKLIFLKTLLKILLILLKYLTKCFPYQYYYRNKPDII